jgi:NTE family protein
MFMLRHLFVLLLLLPLAACTTMPAGFTIDSPPRSTPLHPIAIKKSPVIGIALGGGATRGFAHIGVLNVLEQNGIVPDIVAGTSAGAVVGVLYAGGIRGTKLEDVAQQLNRNQVVDWSYSGRGFILGGLLQKYINNLLDDRPIETLPTVFAATATDLKTGELAVFTSGEAGLAVRASSTIPGLVSPVNINGHDYVDGGLVSKVPVQVAKQLGADIVIAVDVSLLPRDREVLYSTVSVMEQAIAILSQAVITNDLRDADVVIRPDIGIVPLGSFDLKEHMISAGERAAIAAIPEIKRLLAARRKSGKKQSRRPVKQNNSATPTQSPAQSPAQPPSLRIP